MNQEDRFKDFVFIIVEDDEFLMQSRTLLLKEREIIPVCISYGNLRQKVSETVKEVHKSGKFPVIFLGENGDYFSETSDTRIVQDLINIHTQGGVLIPSSTDFEKQKRDWSFFIPPQDSNWQVPATHRVELETECQRFLDVLHNDEQSVEFKSLS